MRNFEDGELYHQGPPPRLVPQAMAGLYAYMGLSGDRHIKGLNAAAMLYAIHPWVDGNGRVGRRLYRFYVPECGLSKHHLRKKIVQRLAFWNVLWNDICRI
ncbi:hypothetical protein [Salinibacter phage M8CRM-1]|uniref:Fido domain-containing protein n=1 Tax=Salinibacter phage M8CRM-1 TaxID=2681612 RepID=A0A2I6UGR4_9CAUD|nr:hypothetical protein FGG67_gp28 [Salinibacter phage M8CRM-1]AUO79160.1 hypothetical protein [Salinibacter phage M8CRM-1]